MVDARYLDVLKIICSRLKDSGFNWALTGSLGMALQGVNVEVHDIDLQTDKRGAYEIEKCLEEHVVRPVRFSESERIRSHYGALEINGVAVEVMGALQKRLDDGKWEEPVNIENYQLWISFDEMEIPVLSLAYEYHAYRILGREDRAKMLMQWLQNKDIE
ncbi:hypothetical protein AMJ86_05085 [bacterium SM23_57]|jgi:hypothetical protein|nr:MAG: hypothetical protein AMJ86_05085 [bacterium SM23_57]